MDPMEHEDMRREAKLGFFVGLGGICLLGCVLVLSMVWANRDRPIPYVSNLAAGDVCSIDQGEHWFKARSDGMCYSADAPR